MARPTLTGTRIRERRMMLGRKQADLARAVEISPSYLNLIEHNRRRIGGKLVGRIARELGVEVSALTEGAEAALVNTLREAAADHRAATEDLPRLEEFVGRFPGWAQLLADTHRRATGLERTVEMLSDRMTHDPFLSTALHEVLSTVTAIQSTATILAETQDIDPEWRARFHRNIAEESRRLAESAAGLVRYLDAAATEEISSSTPQEELDAWLAAQGFHVPEMERALPPEPETLAARAPALESAAARGLATRFLERYRRDAEHMPLPRLREAIAETGLDPAALAARFGVDLAAMFRRLASLPEEAIGGQVGLVACDGSGTLTFRKPVPGFALPRYSAACPLWPLYETLARPMMPIRRMVATAGRGARSFLAYAICQPAGQGAAEGPAVYAGQPVFDGPAVVEALMLIVPADLAFAAAAPGAAGLPDAAQALGVGTSCRICPRAGCRARREPSLLPDEAEVTVPDRAALRL